MIVLDASAAVELLGATPRGQAVLDRLLGEPVLHAPYLLDVEVLNAMRRQVALGSIAEDRAVQALAVFRDLRILRHPHHPFLERIWQLRHNFSAYDSCYLAVTEALGATLLTCDKALTSARLERGAVEVV